jgi:hypothetical protein
MGSSGTAGAGDAERTENRSVIGRLSVIGLESCPCLLNLLCQSALIQCYEDRSYCTLGERRLVTPGEGWTIPRYPRVIDQVVSLFPDGTTIVVALFPPKRTISFNTWPIEQTISA